MKHTSDKHPALQEPWESMSEHELENYAQLHQPADERDVFQRYPWLAELVSVPARIFETTVRLLSRVLFVMTHYILRLANVPIVDLGQKYSATAMNQRLDQLEEALLRQWSNVRDSDFLAPDEEIKQYVAACHVARQYDRVNDEILAKRLGISPAKAALLIERLEHDGIVTEPYTVEFRDVMRVNIETIIDRTINSMQKEPTIKTKKTGLKDAKKH